MRNPLSPALAGLLLAGVLLVVPGGAAHAVPDRDCADFATQAAAQTFYVQQGGPRSDPHRLDGDSDGRACDANPCPCSSATGGGGSSSTGGSPTAQPDREPVRRQRARVERIVDGDTVDVRLVPGGSRARVRLIGIDTPEVHGGEECGGAEASDRLVRLLPRGTRVLLVSDNTQDLRDRYDRLLRYVMKARQDVGRTQLRAGNAEVYVYDGHPFVRVERYRAGQAEARAAGRGIWGAC